MAEYAEDDPKKGEDVPARLNQDMIKLVAGSSTAEYAGTKWRKVEVEQARQNQDLIKSEAEATYDVFLSSALDSNRFADSLYYRLTADGICVFKDDGILDTSKELRLSAYNSKIYIPIFSRYYAGSSRCLDALALMVEHASKSGGKKEILPVFYDVEWLDKKLETTSLYRDALIMQRWRWGAEEVERWKKALVEAGKVKRWKLNSNEREEAIITSIVGEILFKLMIEHNYVLEDLSTGDNPMLSYRTSEA